MRKFRFVEITSANFDRGQNTHKLKMKPKPYNLKVNFELEVRIPVRLPALQWPLIALSSNGFLLHLVTKS